MLLVLNGQQNGAQQLNSLTAHNSNNQCGFVFRGAYMPLVATFAPGLSKPV